MLGRTRTGECLSPRQCPAEDYDDRGPSRASIIRLASAAISSVRLFSRLEGLSANGRVDPGAKIAALQPFPTGLTSIRCPLYSIAVIRRRQCASSRFGPVPVARHHTTSPRNAMLSPALEGFTPTPEYPDETRVSSVKLRKALNCCWKTCRGATEKTALL